MDEQGKAERILQLVHKLGVLRPKDLVPYGIQAEYLRRLCDRGQLKKLGRGSYVAANTRLSTDLILAIVARAIPNGVVCLESALAFHGLGEFDPDEVSVAIERRAAKPRVEFPDIRVARLGGPAFTEGVEVHVRENVKVHVYGDTAIASYTSTYDSMIKGQHYARTIISTDTFIRQNGQWKQIAGHSSQAAK